MDILIIKPMWANKIFDTGKIWEIRGSNTKKRGIIGIAKSGTGLVYGTINLINSIPLTKEQWENNKEKHQVEMTWEELLKIYKHPYAWIFNEWSVRKFSDPVPYIHKRGAVVWSKDESIREKKCKGEEK